MNRGPGGRGTRLTVRERSKPFSRPARRRRLRPRRSCGLPDGTLRYLHDFASAVLILHFEPPAETANPPLPAGPAVWTDRLRQALDLPDALDGFLTDQLGLTTSADPPVVLGFRLDAPHDLAELIDVTDLHQLPGGQHERQAIGYLIADPDGAPPADAVKRAIDHILRYGLQSERP